MIGIFSGGNDSGTAKNNLFYNGTSYGDYASLTLDSNHYVDAGASQGTNGTTATGDPFVDWVNADFGLNSNTTSGVNLGDPFNVDMFGNTRTTWTRGAIEFQSGAPTNNITFTGTLTLTTLTVG